MGRRGPLPTSNDILELRGSTLAGRKPNTPQPPRGRPECPEWLNAIAKAKWEELAPQLDEAGILTLLDGCMLTILCVAWSEFRIATETLQKDGSTITTPAG